MAYKASSEKNGGMSVDLETQIVEAGGEPRVYVTSPKFMGSVRFLAGELRAEELQVGFDPLPENLHHGEVWGTFNKARQKRLQKRAAWFVPIENVELV